MNSYKLLTGKVRFLVKRRFHIAFLILLRQFAKSPLFPHCQRGKLLSPSLAAGP